VDFIILLQHSIDFAVYSNPLFFPHYTLLGNLLGSWELCSGEGGWGGNTLPA